MARCHQSTSLHPRSMSPHCITSPQWVNTVEKQTRWRLDMDHKLDQQMSTTPHLVITGKLCGIYRGCCILTLNMLNCFNDFKRCIHIWYHIFDFVQQKTRFTPEQPYMLPIIYHQYYSCWCPGDFGSQGIIMHGIDPWFHLQHQKS